MYNEFKRKIEIKKKSELIDLNILYYG